MVVTPEIRPTSSSFELIRGSLSAKRVAKRSRLLGGLHRVVDGALLGSIASVSILACLTLHWQHRWSESYKNLDRTRMVANRLTESIALLERDLLKSNTQPSNLVPTKADNLLYLKKQELSEVDLRKSSFTATSNRIINFSIQSGY